MIKYLLPLLFIPFVVFAQEPIEITIPHGESFLALPLSAEIPEEATNVVIVKSDREIKITIKGKNEEAPNK